MNSKRPRLALAGSLISAVLVLAALLPLAGGAQTTGGPTCFGQVGTIIYPDSQYVQGTPEADVIVTGGGGQLINPREGDDLICAGGGKDVVSGGEGNDKINGQRGNDNLRGGPGDDRLKGGHGNDLLNGRAGNDVCVGGTGRDLAHRKKCERIRSAATPF